MTPNPPPTADPARPTGTRPHARSGPTAPGGLSVAEAAARLDALRERIRDAERGPERDADVGPAAADAGGRLEEWASEAFAGEQPPAGVLWSRVVAAEAARRSAPGGGSGRSLIAWVGDWCWLNPRSVDGTPENWLWLRTARQADRVWAIELCCRNPAVSVVVADGRGLAMAATRRLQLAARAGGVRVLLARTPEELRAPSAAPVRGLVDSRGTDLLEGDAGWPRRLPGARADAAVAEGRAPFAALSPAPTRAASPPRWNARLLRRKGLRPTDDPSESGWVVEKRHARMVLRSPGRLADRPPPAEAPQRLAG